MGTKRGIMLNTAQIEIIMFGVGLFLGIYLGYLEGHNDGKLEAIRKLIKQVLSLLKAHIDWVSFPTDCACHFNCFDYYCSDASAYSVGFDYLGLGE